MTLRIRVMLATAALTALTLFTAHAQAQEINFGIIATDSASARRERWEPFFRDMEKQTGMAVKSFYAPDYAGVIEAMRFNKILACWKAATPVAGPWPWWPAATRWARRWSSGSR